MIFVASMISVFFTRYLSQRPKIGVVLGSVISSLILIFMVELISLYTQVNKLELCKIIFASSFIGMTTHEKISNKLLITAPISMVFIYKILSTNLNAQLGGLLGFCAFITVVIYLTVGKLTNSKFFSGRLN